jgi:hypothetical protein
MPRLHRGATARENGLHPVIPSFFTEFVKMLTPEFLANFKMIRQEIHDDTAYIVWSVGDAVPLGTDTLVVTGGKIRIQTFAAHMPT